MSNARKIICWFAILFTVGYPVLRARGEESKPVSKAEVFDRDPNWEGYNNRITPTNPKTVHQDFGFSTTGFAGAAAGEIGGTIWRSPTPASYAAKIPAKTLKEKLTASGTFALTASSGSSGIFIGWFNNERPDGGRQNSLGLHFAGEGSGARLTLQLVTATNQACGTKITPWTVDKSKPKGEGRKIRPPSIRNDGTRYTWTLRYDPEANNGDGQMQFTIHSNRDTHDDFENKTSTVDLPKGYKDEGTTFDRFGLLSSARPGNSMTIYFDDLSYDGVAQAFDNDPDFIGVQNRETHDRKEEGGAHDFGFSNTSNAGGEKPGEIGGTLWRSGSYAYYADRVGDLSFNDRLEAGGKIILKVGLPDSGAYLGFFNSSEKENSPPQAGDFIGIKIGGPTRVGHYFAPAYATAQSSKSDQGDKQHPPNISVEKNTGPVLVPQQRFDWKLVYDPNANDGNGAIDVTLGKETVTLPLKPGDRAKGGALDRFGLFTTHRGGSYLKLYVDDLQYTARPASKSE